MDIRPVRKDRPFPHVLEASALLDRGMDGAAAEVERLIGDCVGSGRHREKRLHRLEQEIRSAIQRWLWEDFAALAGADESIRAVAEKLLAAGGSPYSYIRETCSRVRVGFRDERAARGKEA
jgi:putative protein kinase ArgK-like GTPase of G3E family